MTDIVEVTLEAGFTQAREEVNEKEEMRKWWREHRWRGGKGEEEKGVIYYVPNVSKCSISWL